LMSAAGSASRYAWVVGTNWSHAAKIRTKSALVVVS
jgi:hypothetical protein